MLEYTIDFSHCDKILEIGGGNFPLRDPDGNRLTTNMDMQKVPAVDIFHDLGVFPWPLEDVSYDCIFGKYCLEHLSWHDIEKAIDETYRILKHDGKGIFFIPNTYEQCKKIVEKGVNKESVEMLFGSQEFPDHAGAHKMGFSEDYATELFKKAGFNIVKIKPHPDTITDMILEVYKMRDKSEIFERAYFEDGKIGYIGYRDFATNVVAATTIKTLEPESVLEVGGARGYVTRRFENYGIKAVCMDVSKHCWHNRATDSFVLHDATVVPWPFKDKEFDLTFSIDFLEHIPEDKVDDVIREMARVSKRGYHGIHTSDNPYKPIKEDIDITHVTMKPLDWWKDKFKDVDGYHGRVGHADEMKYHKPNESPPLSYVPGPEDNLVKLNIGSFTDCFYYGWINIDILNLDGFIKEQGYMFQQCDVTKGLQYSDDGVDIISSSHMLEHLTREEGNNFLKECYRVLKKDGVIRISVPDAGKLTKEYLDGSIMDYRYINVGVEKASDNAEAFHELLMSGHKTIYDEVSLSKMLGKVGFKDIKRVSPFESRSDVIQRQTTTTHPTISVVIEAEK